MITDDYTPPEELNEQEEYFWDEFCFGLKKGTKINRQILVMYCKWVVKEKQIDQNLQEAIELNDVGAANQYTGVLISIQNQIKNLYSTIIFPS